MKCFEMLQSLVHNLCTHNCAYNVNNRYKLSSYRNKILEVVIDIFITRMSK